MHDVPSTIKISTTFNPATGEIIQDVDMFGEITRTIMRTREQQIIDSLISLGWKPPKSDKPDVFKQHANAWAKGVTRACDHCGAPYQVRQADLDRGWGRCCSKPCAAAHREKSKAQFIPMNKLDLWKYQTPPDKAYLHSVSDIEDDFHPFDSYSLGQD